MPDARCPRLKVTNDGGHCRTLPSTSRRECIILPYCSRFEYPNLVLTSYILLSSLVHCSLSSSNHSSTMIKLLKPYFEQ